MLLYSIFVSSVIMYIFFFFQAEDGIRDVAVTGVQTCALPILTSAACSTSRIEPEAAEVLSARCIAATDVEWQDRKSTRLNSSHGYISYAVFCLKKKIHCASRTPPPSAPARRSDLSLKPSSRSH